MRGLLFFLLIGVGLSWSQMIAETGFLRNVDGMPVTGTVMMNYKLYTQPTGGAPVWDSSQLAVSVNEGLYTVLLGGSSNPIDDTVISSTANYYFEYSVNGVIFPQRELVVWSLRAVQATYALRADTAVTANTALNALTATSIKQQFRQVNASTVINADDNVVLADPVDPINLTLPDATLFKGQSFTIKKVDQTLNWVRVLAQTGQLIEGFSLTPLMAPGDSVTVLSDGSSRWLITCRR